MFVVPDGFCHRERHFEGFLSHSDNGARRGCPYAAIVFDAVGTIIYADPSPAEVYCRVAAAHGWQGTVEQVCQRLPAAMRSQFQATQTNVAASLEAPPASPLNYDAPLLCVNQDLEHRNRWRAVVANVLWELDSLTTHVVFEQLWQHFGSSHAWRVYADAQSAWQWCLDQEVLVAIASNFDSRLQRVLHGHSLFAQAACVITSAQVGAAKPDRDFYRAVAEAMQVAPSSALMIGDDFRADFEGARRAGFHSVWLDRGAKTNDQPDSIPSLDKLPQWIVDRPPHGVPCG